MSRMKLRTWLLLLVVTPCLITLTLAFRSVEQRRTTAEQAESLIHLSKLAVVIGDLLHQTQRERGTSSVFLSSGGSKFADRLPEQRKATDDVRLRFFELLETERHAWPAHVVAGLELAASSLRDIEARRRQISTLEISPADEMAYYTEMNQRLLDSLGALVANTADVGLRGVSTAYLAFLHAKEKTGLERAQGANAFGTGRFTPGQLGLVAGLIESQQAYLTVFLQQAPDDVAAAFRERMSGPVAAEVRRMEGLLLGRSGDFGVDSATWYTTMTKKIDLEKEVEDLLAVSVQQGSLRIAEHARESLWGGFGLAALFLVAAIFVTLALCRSIVAPLRSLTAALESWAALRNWEAWQIRGPAEVRDLSRAFSHLVEACRDRTPAAGITPIGASGKHVMGR